MTNFEKYNNVKSSLVFDTREYDKHNNCVVIYYKPKHASELIKLYAFVCHKGDEVYMTMKWGLKEYEPIKTSIISKHINKDCLTQDACNTIISDIIKSFDEILNC